jgi:hypothetical protein
MGGGRNVRAELVSEKSGRESVMGAEIIEHNFGKTDRDHARRFLMLLGTLAEHEEKVLANPGLYLGMANKKISAYLK